MNTSLARASDDEFAGVMAAVLDRISGFSVAFNIPAEDFVNLAQIYTDAMRDIPPDLILEGAGIALKSWKWGNRLPLPAEILVHTEAKLDDRRRARILLESIDKQLRDDEAAREPARQAKQQAVDDYRRWRNSYYQATFKTPEESGEKWPGPGYTRYIPPAKPKAEPQEGLNPQISSPAADPLPEPTVAQPANSLPPGGGKLGGAEWGENPPPGPIYSPSKVPAFDDDF